MSHTNVHRRTWLASTAAAATGLALGGCAATGAPQPARTGSPLASLPGTTQADWHDPASGHTWRVWTSTPSAPAPAAGYPVLVLLDGNAAFALAAQLVRNDASRPPPLRPDPLLVVGIGHPIDAPYDNRLRQRDYTPPPVAGQPVPDRGGVDRLLDFLSTRVLPGIGASAPIDARRMGFFGHSFGGLAVVHTLLTRPSMFTRYAAASPSLWWNNGQVPAAVDGFLARHASDPRAFQAQLQLSVGELETAEAAATPARAQVQRERRMIEHARTLASRLQAAQWPELAVDNTVLPGLDHGGVMLPALLNAIEQTRRPTPA